MRHRASGRCACTIIHPACAQDHEEREGCDTGFSLIEIVIAFTLMGLVVVAILNAVTTTVHASSVGRAAANVETTLVNAADRVNRAPKACDYTIYVQAAVQTQGWAPTTATVTHEYYIPAADARTAGTWMTGPPGSTGCAGSRPTELLVQRVRISITSPNGEVRRSIDVVKSDV